MADCQALRRLPKIIVRNQDQRASRFCVVSSVRIITEVTTGALGDCTPTPRALCEGNCLEEEFHCQLPDAGVISRIDTSETPRGDG